MSKEIVAISPENLEVANAYVTFGNITAVATELGLPQDSVSRILGTKEVRRYIDNMYLDQGYRNRNNLASVMDTIIAKKLEEAEESDVYSSKDLADLLNMAHKMRMDEIKALETATKTESIRNQTNVQINDGMPFGQGNYGKLMEKLMKGDNG